MQTTVYLPNHQLQELLQIHTFFHRGIGFHWEKEGVIHAFTQFPDVAPSGKPLLVLFKKLGLQESLETCQEQLEAIEASVNITESVPVPQFICLFFQQNRAIAYLKKGETIIPYTVESVADGEQVVSKIGQGLLQSKKVLIIGLGGLGMQICKDLAAAGVGHFTLLDTGRIDQRSVRYHLRGWQDFGRNKTATAQEVIWSFHPTANIVTYEVDLAEDTNVLENACQQVDLVVCATDNNATRARVNSMALTLRKPTFFTRMLRNQAGGEIFRMRADATAPCFGCLLCTGRFFQENQEETLETLSAGLQHELAPISSQTTRLILASLLGNTTNTTTDYSLWSNEDNQSLETLWNLIHPNNINPKTLQWLGLQFAKFRNCPACGAG